MIINKFLSITLVCFSLAACSNVELSVEGEKTRVLEASEVTKCSYIGKTTSSTTNKVVGVTRHQKAIDLELITLARNTAKKLGGDTVVAEDPAEEGRLTFLIYRCVPQ